MCFLTVSCLQNLPIDDTREVPILLLLMLYPKPHLRAWYVLKELSSPPRTRRQSFCWSPLLRADSIRTQEKKCTGKGEVWKPR